MAGARADILYGRTRARADVFHSRACARTDVLHSRASAGAYVLHGRVEPLAYQLTGTSTDVFHGRVESLPDQLAGARTDILHSRVEPFADQITGTLSDVRNCGADALYQLLDDLRVAVYGGEDPVQDGGDVIEPDLEQRLRLHALNDQLHPAKVRIDTDRQLHQIEHLREEVDLRPQIV